MINKESKSEIRHKKHARLRHYISGTPERPRLSVFRSNRHMYAQIIDDTVGKTICAASTMEKGASELEYTDNTEAAAFVGKEIAKRALEKGVTKVVFDRGGFVYHGKIQALADAAREAGLDF